MVENGWMTLREASEYTRISVDKLRVALQRGDVPGATRTHPDRGGRWRVKASQLDAWLESQNGKAN